MQAWHRHSGPATALCGPWSRTPRGFMAPPLHPEDRGWPYSSQTMHSTRHSCHACRAAQQGIMRPHPNSFIFRQGSPGTVGKAVRMKLELVLTCLRFAWAAEPRYRAFYARWSIISRLRMFVVLLRGMGMTPCFLCISCISRWSIAGRPT